MKAEVIPPVLGPVQIRATGVHKNKAHEVRLLPPEGRGDPITDVAIADADGNLSASAFLYAPGEWGVEIRLSSADKDALTRCSVTV